MSSSNNTKYVNLAELSLSGSLMPSVPVQLMLKYDPPKITIVYHFEQRENERFYHEIFVERRMLETMTDEDICSHLYVTEAYYFNPKQIKRQQIIRLIKKLKEGMVLRKQQKEQGKSQELLEQEQRRKNFFQRKRFVNYDMHAAQQQDEESDHEEPVLKQNINQPVHSNNSNQQSLNHSQQNNNLLNFEEDPPVIASHHSPKMQKPVGKSAGGRGAQQHASFPAQEVVQHEMRRPVSKLPPLETSGTKSQGFDMLQQQQQQQQQHQPVAQVSANNNNGQRQTVIANNNSNSKQQYDDLLEMQDYEAESDNFDDHLGMVAGGSPGHQMHGQYQHNNSQSHQQQVFDGQAFHPQQPLQQVMEGAFIDQQQQLMQQQDGGDQEEEESVYIKDNVVMRRIQIEGEDQEYLMDPDGNIYDMNGNFIGTANANELEEMEEDNLNGGGNNGNLLDEQQLIN